jgi:hypothetical protein
MNEDEIIAQAFIDIKEGILEVNWQKVCGAYEKISGEKIEPPTKPKTRLEAIREKMQDKTPKPKKEPKKKEPKTVTDQDTGEEIDIDESDVIIKKFQGGQRFAKEGFEVIEAEVDPTEQAKNLKLAQKKKSLPKHLRSAKPKDNSDDDADTESYRFYEKPKQKPPWA